jgi:antitoxin MazE
MLAKIQKWGNSQGLRLTKNLLADAQLGVGDEVDISVKDGVMIVTPAKKIRGKHQIEDLVARIPENYQANEVEWGEPVGKEVW